MWIVLQNVTNEPYSLGSIRPERIPLGSLNHNVPRASEEYLRKGAKLRRFRGRRVDDVDFEDEIDQEADVDDDEGDVEFKHSATC